MCRYLRRPVIISPQDSKLPPMHSGSHMSVMLPRSQLLHISPMLPRFPKISPHISPREPKEPSMSPSDPQSIFWHTSPIDPTQVPQMPSRAGPITFPQVSHRAPHRPCASSPQDPRESAHWHISPKLPIIGSHDPHIGPRHSKQPPQHPPQQSPIARTPSPTFDPAVDRPFAVALIAAAPPRRYTPAPIANTPPTASAPINAALWLDGFLSSFLSSCFLFSSSLFFLVVSYDTSCV
mmetsp:Transcript_13790/g.24911  ORF Transcript_13790/g.24911 Transcript_13790/m.24911 type:complete len:236 (+) Transcript_13790:531-1238(+)